MSKPILYRYFKNAEYAQQFIGGSVRFQSLSYYKNTEDASRADRIEGSLLHRPMNGLVLTRMADGAQLKSPDTYAPTVRSDEVFVLCMSSKNSARLKEKLGPFCVEIKRFGILKTRLNNELAKRFPKNRRVLIDSAITYYEEADEVGINWIPERIVMRKLRSFEDEFEVRVAFSVSGALDIGSEVHSFLPPASLPERTQNPPPITLEVGDLSPFCRLLA